MQKLHNKCEEYVKANPEEFESAKPARAKFDMEENRMIEAKNSKKKGGLDYM